MGAYKRKADWNDQIIKEVNELVDECGEGTKLEEVGTKHRWSKTDITDVQDLLKELCTPEPEFDDLKDIWSQKKVDELKQEIEDCVCCEQADLDASDGFAGFGTYAFQGGYRLFFSGGADAHDTWDVWGWIMQQRMPVVVSTKECNVEEDGPPATIEVRSGGRGWLGRQYKRWELHLYHEPAGDQIILQGDVVDGYIQVPEGDLKPYERCGQSPGSGSGTPQGNNDPEWNFRYQVDAEDPEDIDTTYVLKSLNSSFQLSGLDGDFFTVPGFLPIDPLTPPYVLFSSPAGTSLSTVGSTIKRFIRVLCE